MNLFAQKPEQIVQLVALSRQREEKQDYFLQLQTLLETPGRIKNKKIVIPLLYDQDAYIRQEAAFWIERYGLKLKDEDYARYLFALQDFPTLMALGASCPSARALLFSGFEDKNMRLRTRLLKTIHEKDCRTMQETILYFYGRGDYESLTAVYFNCSHEDRAFLLDLLRRGTLEQNNMPYHRRQCALLLEKLCGAEELDEAIRELLEPTRKTKEPIPLSLPPQPLKEYDRLELLIDKLQRRGLWVDGGLLFPQINRAPATGRITYRKPGLQTWPGEERLRRLQPADKSLIIFDYNSVEPMILLNILLNEHLLSLPDIPQEDIYLAICPQDRALGKRFLNRLINGGRIQPEFTPGPFFWKLLPALDELRAELWIRFNQKGGVQTIGGRFITLDRTETNLSGKMMNRLIQGGAADLFNNAMVELDERLEKDGSGGEVYFLLFDEVWVAAQEEQRARVEALTRSVLNEQYKRYGFTLPITADKKQTTA